MDPSREEKIAAADPSRDEKIVASAPDPDNAGDDENLKVDPMDTARVIDRAAERKLCLKFDVRLIPVLAIMCMFTYLARGKIEALPLSFICHWPILTFA